MYDIAASIVTYHPDMPQLQAAVASFAEPELQLHLTLVDNSCDATVTDSLRPLTPDVIAAPRNGGYGYGHNLALHAMPDSRYWLVMNPDVEIHPGTLKAMVAAMDADPSIVLMVPKVLFPDGRLQPLNKRLPTVFDFFVRRFLPKGWCEQRMRQYEMRDEGYDAPTEVPFCSGCFMLFRREVAEKLGGFDERYFMYLEDCDITRRAAQYGRCLYIPYAVITHHWQRGSHKSWRLMRVMLHSMWVYFNTWGWRWMSS
ncbi:MAG: hypothetical protein CMM93_01105 [Rickettsiales bacterium]|nr:hypothetical protein [Rickettsiales bacterium]|tara:strand:- start:968 stop:1735 length:768 start_codon:yes stop_codon:yes gene_type:complete